MPWCVCFVLPLSYSVFTVLSAGAAQRRVPPRDAATATRRARSASGSCAEKPGFQQQAETGMMSSAACDGKTMFGVVVAGLGIAGQVRIRDLLSPLPSSPAEKMSIKGFVSRRNLQEQQGVTQIPLDEALSREDIHAAIVSTENSSHEDYVRKFLEAGKHVCVEYPMALSYAAAVELFRLADEKGKVLHVEHIELLAADYRQLKKEVCGKSLQEGSLHFTAGPVAPGFGSLAFSGISRLTWLVDLFGELSVTGAKLTEEPEKKYTKLTAHLLTQDRRYEFSARGTRSDSSVARDGVSSCPSRCVSRGVRRWTLKAPRRRRGNNLPLARAAFLRTRSDDGERIKAGGGI
ncbi:biliverdin reductase A isoform X2 [Scleropages formosus]|uniref:biliverdin reductase A isoform X2 n=1 Tax=Scleropages formosus TaxID=113540 RepID=UPI0010FA7A6C|nr:biliverdin reductase A isoform X2 [Scleropages formosus]